MKNGKRGLDDSSWNEKAEAWATGCTEASQEAPLRIPKHEPKMQAIESSTRRFLRWKALRYLFTTDEKGLIKRYILPHPLRYWPRFLASLFGKNRVFFDKGLFFYGCRHLEDFIQKLENSQSRILIGFSYCQKPHECPSGRFSTECAWDPSHMVCRQCPIGRTRFFLDPLPVDWMIITTIHHLGEWLLEKKEQSPQSTLFFAITSCPLALEMFKDWGYMIDACGIGFAFSGRICNTMRAFELSERGVKPGLTHLSASVNKEFDRFIRSLYVVLQEPSIQST